MRSNLDPTGSTGTTPAADAAALDDALFGIATDAAATAMVDGVARHVTPEDIQAAFHSSLARHGPGGLSMTEPTLLLLKGGLAFLNLVSSPLDMRLPATGEAAAGWARWRESRTGGYEIEDRDSGLWFAIEGAEIDRTGQNVDQLSGTRVHSVAWSSGPTTVVRRESLVMTASGEVERRGFRLATFDGNPGLSQRVRSSYSEWSSVDTADRHVDGNIVHDRYTMLEDGLTLEIHRVDSRIERYLGFSLGGDYVLDGRCDIASSREASLSAPGVSAHDTTLGNGGGAWLALMAESDGEWERREGKDGTRIDPDVLAREAARRAR